MIGGELFEERTAPSLSPGRRGGGWVRGGEGMGKHRQASRARASAANAGVRTARACCEGVGHTVHNRPRRLDIPDSPDIRICVYHPRNCSRAGDPGLLTRHFYSFCSAKGVPRHYSQSERSQSACKRRRTESTVGNTQQGTGPRLLSPGGVSNLMPPQDLQAT